MLKPIATSHPKIDTLPCRDLAGPRLPFISNTTMVAADNHGCRLDKGQRWCSLLKECVGERVPRRRRDPQFPPKMNLAAKCRYDQCDPGTHDTGACTYEWAGLSWDVSPLRRAAHYVIKDVEDQDEVAYTVGICRDVNPADVHAACEETTGSARESMDEAAPAYQVFDAHGDDAHGAECYRTGGTLGDVGNSKWGLIDPQNPSGGVYVRYYGGNTCSKTSPTHCRIRAWNLRHSHSKSPSRCSSRRPTAVPVHSINSRQ